jgi:hypothetical protein
MVLSDNPNGLTTQFTSKEDPIQPAVNQRNVCRFDGRFGTTGRYCNANMGLSQSRCIMEALPLC